MHLELLTCNFFAETKPHSLAKGLPELFKYLAGHCTDGIPDPDDHELKLVLAEGTGWRGGALKTVLFEDASSLERGDFSKVFR